MKDVIGYEGRYAVTEDGRVYSHKSGRFLRPVEKPSGYLYIGLHNETGRKNKYIHRLVAETFLENKNKLPQVNHRDENKKNNCIDNLEFCDAKYNNSYGTRIQRSVKPVACLETGEVFESGLEASKQTGIWRSGICSCCKGKQKTAGGFRWRYVGGE